MFTQAINPEYQEQYILIGNQRKFHIIYEKHKITENNQSSQHLQNANFVKYKETTLLIHTYTYCQNPGREVMPNRLRHLNQSTLQATQLLWLSCWISF